MKQEKKQVASTKYASESERTVSYGRRLLEKQLSGRMCPTSCVKAKYDSLSRLHSHTCMHGLLFLQQMQCHTHGHEELGHARLVFCCTGNTTGRCAAHRPWPDILHTPHYPANPMRPHGSSINGLAPASTVAVRREQDETLPGRVTPRVARANTIAFVVVMQYMPRPTAQDNPHTVQLSKHTN